MRSLTEVAPFDLDLAEQLLGEVSSDYEHSRKLEAQKASRPDVAETLKQLGESAGRVGGALDDFGEFTSRLKLGLKWDGEHWLHMTDMALAIDELAENLSIPHLYPEIAAVPAAIVLGTTLRNLAEMLASLPQIADWELIVFQEERPLSDHAQGGDLELASCLRWLITACEGVRAILKKQRGLKSDSVQMRAVAGLADVYEHLLRSPPTYSVRESRNYTGEPQTTFARMVEPFSWNLSPTRQSDAVIRAPANWPSSNDANFLTEVIAPD